MRGRRTHAVTKRVDQRRLILGFLTTFPILTRPFQHFAKLTATVFHSLHRLLQAAALRSAAWDPGILGAPDLVAVFIDLHRDIYFLLFGRVLRRGNLVEFIFGLVAGLLRVVEVGLVFVTVVIVAVNRGSRSKVD